MNLRDDARRELDSVVINIELTLVSIIQGVALFFLTDNARLLLSIQHADAFIRDCSARFAKPAISLIN